MSLSNERTLFAADVFLRRLAVEVRKAHPERECPITCIFDVPPQNRAAFVKAIDAALKSQSRSADELFLNWQLSARESGTSPTPPDAT